MIRIPILLTIIFALGLGTSSAQKLQRLPLQKKKIEVKSPSSWSKSARIDPRTKKEVPFDPKPRIELADARASKYSLKWIGYDGKEKVVVYQRPDCVDVVVAALAKRSSSGTYEYEYNVRSLATSGDYLHGFAVQNFGPVTSPKRPSIIENVFAGDMIDNPFDSSGGNWIRFAPLPPHPKVQPGQTIRFKLYSSSPPGLVMCRVDGGDHVMKGVGEDMPGELGESLDALGYKAWPSGYTIGPVERLKTLSKPERAKYVLQLLPQFQKLGWMTAKARQRYENILRREDLEGAYKRAEQDLKAGTITTEVLSILQGLKAN